MNSFAKDVRRTIVLGLVTGLVIALVGSMVLSASARSVDDVAPAPPRTFVYTITNPEGPNAIAAYEANNDTGELAFLGTYATGGLGTGRLVDSQSPLMTNPEGTLLFAVNPGSDDISVMSINADGSLSLINPPVPSRGVEPASLTLSNDLLYVANKGDLVDPPSFAGFRVEADGSLTRIKRRITLAMGDNPTQVLFNHDGSLLIGIRLGSGGLDSFSVRPNGRLRFLSELNNQRGPFAGVFRRGDETHLLVADARMPGLSSYLISDTGSISRLAGLSNAPERAACWITVHPNGRRAWVSNTGTNSLSLYTVGDDGTLSLAGTRSTADYGRTPFEIILDPSSRFLYQLNIGAANQNVNALRITESDDNAGLLEIGAIALPAGSAPIGLAVANR